MGYFGKSVLFSGFQWNITCSSYDETIICRCKEFSFWKQLSTYPKVN